MATRERHTGVRFPGQTMFAIGLGVIQGVFAGWAVHPTGWRIAGVEVFLVALVITSVATTGYFLVVERRLKMIGQALELLAVWVLVRPVSLYFPSFVARDVGPRPGARLAVDSLTGFFIAIGVAFIVAVVFISLGRVLVRQSEHQSLEEAYATLEQLMENPGSFG